jgi:hypothetical protein
MSNRDSRREYDEVPEFSPDRLSERPDRTNSSHKSMAAAIQLRISKFTASTATVSVNRAGLLRSSADNNQHRLTRRWPNEYRSAGDFDRGFLQAVLLRTHFRRNQLGLARDNSLRPQAPPIEERIGKLCIQVVDGTATPARTGDL